MPIFGIPFFLVSKIILKIKNKYLTNFFFEMPIFKSAIRFLSGKERYYIANTLSSYNTLSNNALENIKLDEETTDKIKQLNKNGYCNLGKIFSDEECDNFIKSLENKNCFNSQTPMQSNGKIIKFQPRNNSFSNLPYYVFLPETSFSFFPIQKLLNDKKIKSIINSYLNFHWKIYCCMTWYNPETSENHYVHNLHRDTDDYRYLGLFIYWNKVTKSNGSTSFIPKSHKQDIDDLKNNEIFVECDKGTGILADLNAWHAGNKVLKGCRYVTNIRFGKDNTYASVVDGSVLTPTSEQLKFLN
jgi:ectoine hydroxylase-related dioxygenase (phytanoyl-CoA dioxygenase family)